MIATILFWDITKLSLDDNFNIWSYVKKFGKHLLSQKHAIYNYTRGSDDSEWVSSIIVLW